MTQRLIACLLSGQNAQCHLTNLQTDLTSTVTFERTRQDTLTVIKRTVGGDGPFPFVSHSLCDFSLTTVNGEAQRSFGNLAPGLYDLSETVPTGWIQTSAACDNGDAPDNINLAPGQTVKCTFVNRYTSTIADIPTTLRVGIVDPRGTIARARRSVVRTNAIGRASVSVEDRGHWLGLAGNPGTAVKDDALQPLPPSLT